MDYKHQYESMKKMVTVYQDEIVPGLWERIKELEKQVPMWIPVSERLPDENKRILVLLSSKISVVAYIRQNVWYVAWNQAPLNHVTHWMPLPEPPKEKENG